jgi:hypothetical protein
MKPVLAHVTLHVQQVRIQRLAANTVLFPFVEGWRQRQLHNIKGGPRKERCREISQR